MPIQGILDRGVVDYLSLALVELIRMDIITQFLMECLFLFCEGVHRFGFWGVWTWLLLLLFNLLLVLLVLVLDRVFSAVLRDDSHYVGKDGVRVVGQLSIDLIGRYCSTFRLKSLLPVTFITTLILYVIHMRLCVSLSATKLVADHRESIL